MEEGWRGIENEGGMEGGCWEMEGDGEEKNGGRGLGIYCVSKAPTPSIRHLLSEASSTVPGPQWSVGALCNSLLFPPKPMT